jgi:hypothetical protein
MGSVESPTLTPDPSAQERGGEFVAAGVGDATDFRADSIHSRKKRFQFLQ